MKDLLFIFCRPEQVVQALRGRIGLVTVCVLFGLSLGVGKYILSQRQETKSLYEIAFSLKGANFDEIKAIFAEPTLVADVLNVPSEAIALEKQISSEEVISWIQYPSALEGKFEYFVLRIIPDVQVKESEAITLLSKLAFGLPTVVKNQLIASKPSTFVLPLPHVTSTSDLLPEDFLAGLLKSNEFEQCLVDKNDEHDSIRYSILDALELETIGVDSVRSALTISHKRNLESPVGSDPVKLAWKTFFECYETMSVEEVRSLFASVNLYGPFSPKVAGPYLPVLSRDFVFDFLFSGESARAELVKATGISYASARARIEPIFSEGPDRQSVWLTTKINLVGLSGGTALVDFFKNHVFPNPEKTTVKQQNYLTEKPELNDSMLVSVLPREVSKIKLKIIEAAKYKEKVSPPYKLMPMVILFSILGLFAGIFLSVILEFNVKRARNE